MKKIKIALVTSRGGHFYTMMALKEWWLKYDRFWITFEGQDISPIKSDRKYFAFFPESRNIVNFFRNLLLAWMIIHKERPTMIVSAGAGIAPPFFYIGKLFGAKLVYIEPYDFIRFPSLTARLSEPVVDAILVQTKTQLKFFGPKAIFKGSII